MSKKTLGRYGLRELFHLLPAGLRKMKIYEVGLYCLTCLNESSPYKVESEKIWLNTRESLLPVHLERGDTGRVCS